MPRPHRMTGTTTTSMASAAVRRTAERRRCGRASSHRTRMRRGPEACTSIGSGTLEAGASCRVHDEASLSGKHNSEA